MHPAMMEMLAAERIRDMVAQGDNARRARQGRQAREARQAHEDRRVPRPAGQVPDPEPRTQPLVPCPRPGPPAGA